MPLLILSLVMNLLTVALTLLIPILIGRGIDCIAGPSGVDFARLFELLTRVAFCVAASALLQ